MGQHGPAIEWRHFPWPEHAECVLDRPAHCFRDLIGNTQCQRANVFRLDRECERPLLPKRMELLAVFLRAAIAFGAALVAVDVERDGIVADRLNA